MNGVMAGIVAGILLLIAAVVGVVSMNGWGNNQQAQVQNYTTTQITQAESQAAGQ
ncbi:MAG: hypothetical protein K6T81_12650 [Alicyclobacillus macrosporangiidus]|uniref:hypothetical protein n=1 Tax=Alicyclobacillus macrosporangiidus TaxID=392015 RepID=UPI0026EC9524|nr:hypothetical protein [Alicyclobacillus macrosporangiidus]MCL6599573.1 hypothetical protein [Alicyclobacillus macrosporangiidus]